MMGACSSGALKIYPPFQHYNGTTEFTSFICSNDDDSYVNPDDVEWLNPNFTMLTSTLNNRICGIIQLVSIDKYYNINVYPICVRSRKN